jgi:hypothetical protein
MQPKHLAFIYCFDARIWPELYSPTLCVFRERNKATGDITGSLRVCTAVQSLEPPYEKYWINTAGESGLHVQPFGFLDLAEHATDIEFLTLLAASGSINFTIVI